MSNPLVLDGAARGLAAGAAETASSAGARRPPPRSHLLLLALLVLAVWAPRLQGPIDLRYDAGVYYILGTSLAQGSGYRLLGEPGDPEAVQYPPLLPAFVALHQRALGSEDPAVVGWYLRLSFMGIYALFLFATYLLARRSLRDGLALVVAFLTGLGLFSWYLSDLLFTEVPFALLAVLFVLAAREPDPSRGPAWGREVASGVAAGAAFLLRTAGLALLAAWVLEAVCHRRWRRAAVRAAVAALPVLAWQAWIGHVQASPDYQEPAYAYQRASYQYYNVPYAENALLIDPFEPELGRASAGELARRLLTNAATMPPALGESVSLDRGWWRWVLTRVQEKAGVDLLPPWLVLVPITLLAGVTAAGVSLWLKQRRWRLLLTVVLSLGLICSTPWPGQFTRYLAPLVPFLALAFVEALGLLGRVTRRRWTGWRARLGPAALIGAVGAALLLQSYGLVRTFRLRAEEGRTYPLRGDAPSGQRLLFYDRTWRAFDAAVAWLSWRAAPGDVVAATSPHRVHLVTGRDAVMPPMEPDPAAAQRLLDTVPARWIVIDELDFLDISRRYARPVVEAHPDRWRLAYTVPGSATRVYERVGLTPSE